jgi:photosystem II stability/assembly factor-like uncharacterized protein
MKNIKTKFLIIFGILFFQTKYSEANWQVVHTVSTKLIWHIAYADDNTIYAVGDSLLMKSMDGGNNWIDLLPNIASLTNDKKFFNLKFLNKDTGFIFRNTQTENLFQTTDGGTTWSNVSPNVLPLGMLDVEFVNQSVGYAVGGFFMDSSIARTNDGGQTWLHIPKPSLCDAPMAVHFITDSIGFTGDNEIFKTTDAGATWIATSTSGGWPHSGSYGDRVTNYNFFDNQIGYAIRDDWHIYKTIDGGNTWTLSQLPVSGINTGCRDIVFDQNNFGYIVGYGLSQPFISSDAGNTWLLDGTYPISTHNTCISISNKHKVIVGTVDGDVVLNENSPLSTISIADLSSLNLYPNPTTGIFYLNTDKKIKSIEVYNLIGASVFKTNPNSNINIHEINLTNIPKGIYVVKISNETNSIQRKLIIEK